MKFQFKQFYPLTDLNRGRERENALGTVHIYVVDCKLDIRGIRVSTSEKGIYFNMPSVLAADHETGEKVRYPVLHWDTKTQKEMLDFLHNEVKPEIKKRLGIIKSQTKEQEWA